MCVCSSRRGWLGSTVIAGNSHAWLQLTSLKYHKHSTITLNHTMYVSTKTLCEVATESKSHARLAVTNQAHFRSGLKLSQEWQGVPFPTKRKCDFNQSGSHPNPPTLKHQFSSEKPLFAVLNWEFCLICQKKDTVYHTCKIANKSDQAPQFGLYQKV